MKSDRRAGRQESAQVAVEREECVSGYHVHVVEECGMGGEHWFGGEPHRLVGQRFPMYVCMKCGRAAVGIYRCVR